ncbi:hypothetical protein [Streptomyces werraensis]|uniref:hypothetical protein n=1 Tax=Streptomyces werraensis TaxID=68284 RepID=UPI0036FB13DC
MAEISYPFTSDSAGGGQQMMSQLQWQYMARQFGQDRVDYRLPDTSLSQEDLPFDLDKVSNYVYTVNPGRALVGGFFYQLTADMNVTLTANTGTTGRIDLIVLRADFSKGAVNLAVKTGQPSATPVVPSLTRTYGGVWEMALHQVTVPANGGTTVSSNVSPYDTGETVSVPWNAPLAGALQQSGTFLLDMDNNVNDVQTEYFKGRDGFFQTRHLGKRLSYTPAPVNGNRSLGTENRMGHWRRVGPGLVYFSARLETYEDQGIGLSSGAGWLGITLPKPASKNSKQVLTGLIQNSYMNGDYPNIMHILGYTIENTSNLVLTTPNPNNLAEGLDGLRQFPANSIFSISGIYETNELD